MADNKVRYIFDIFRYNSELSHNPWSDHFCVFGNHDWSILDALNYIKDEVDGSLSFRWSCRMGICGSCGMMVNGKPTLTCGTFCRDYPDQTIKIEPLTNFPVIRDLVINYDDFIEKMSRIRPWIELNKDHDDDTKPTRQTPGELARYHQFSFCINCMLCYSACPVYGMKSEFIGPAAVATAQRYNLDPRDDGSKRRAPHLADQNGIWECTLVNECSAVCPKNVDPAGAIQQLKVQQAKDWWLSWLLPIRNKE